MEPLAALSVGTEVIPWWDGGAASPAAYLRHRYPVVSLVAMVSCALGREIASMEGAPVPLAGWVGTVVCLSTILP